MYKDEEFIRFLKEDRDKGAVVLLEQYAGLVWSVCSKRLQDVEDVKECVNETFADFCLNYEKFDPQKCSLKTYLCLIADRKSIDIFRKNLKNQAIVDAEIKKQAEQFFSNEDDLEIEKLEEALEKLSPVDSQILRMKYYDGMSYREIAGQLGMNYENVKKRSLRSKRALYLLIIGMVLAVLIACAAIVFKKYQFSGRLGYIWSEDAVYELVNEGEYLENNILKFTVTDAVYKDGSLEVVFEIVWIGEEITDEEFERKILNVDPEIDIWDEYLYVLGDEGQKNRFKSIKVKGIRDELACQITVIAESDVTLKAVNNEITVQLGIDEGKEVTLRLSKLEIQEYEESANIYVLPDSSTLSLGPSIASSDFTYVNLEYDNSGKYQLGAFLLNSMYGMGVETIESAALTDDTGNVYSSMIITSTDVDQRQEFSLRFMGVPAGTYMLKLPYLCVMKDEVSETATLNLPTGDEEYKECDVTVLFEEGYGLHITGIRREESYNLDVTYEDDGSETITKSNLVWKYYLEYEAISNDQEMKFCSALVQVVNAEELRAEEGVGYGNLSQIRIPQEFDVESVEIYFTKPTFKLQQEIEMEVTIVEETE